MSFSKEELSIITLHLVPDIGPQRFKKLMQHFGSAEAALNASNKEIAAIENIPFELAQRIADAKKNIDTEKEIALAKKIGAEIITCIDKKYPDSLKNISDPPILLYVLGEIKSKDDLSAAVVGTRHPTSYGKNVAEQFCYELAKNGITSISGLARGIDTIAHNVSIAAGGRTIAVLGNGLNRSYPPENRKLQEKIALHGAVVSEFPMDLHPDKINFPRRNRIISGLAYLTVVIEADIKSGALITARYSAEQGKDVFAVPGSIFSRYSNGCHSLIKSGARLAQSIDDIIDEIKPSVKNKTEKLPVAQEFDFLSQIEKQIISLLEEKPQGLTIDNIGLIIKCSNGELASSLLELEMKGMIRSLPGKVYSKY